jgi:hypothetical protein
MSGALPRIGIYVHHHGNGHAARAEALAVALRERGAEVACLGSGVPGALGEGAGPDDVELPLDTDLGSVAGKTPAELHFAPLGSAGLAGRMARIAGWICEWRPDLVLVDVSVEVAMLARLCGVPFAYLRQTGERDDPAHQLAYGWAAGLLAPYMERQEPEGTPGWIRAMSGYAGAVSRFDGLPRPPRRGRYRRAIVLGEGGEELAATIAAAARGWQILGPRPVGLRDLARSAVVVAPAGANTVAEAAFANCGLVCIPRERPFGEQMARARMLAADDAAVVLDALPPAAGWPSALEEARRRRPALAEWADGAGAGRAADYLLGLVAGSSRSAASSQSTRPSAPSSSSQPLAGHSPQRSR